MIWAFLQSALYMVATVLAILVCMYPRYALVCLCGLLAGGVFRHIFLA